MDKSKKTSKIQQLNRKDMFMVKSKIFLFFLLCVGTMNLNAESPHSFGIGGLNTSVDSQDLSSGGLVYEYKTDNVALEASVYFGGSATDAVDGINLAVDIDSVVSTKLKYGSGGEKSYFYGFIGYTSISLNAVGCAFGTCAAASDTTDGFEAGVGLDLDVGENWILGGKFSTGFNDLDETDFFALDIRYRF